MYRVGAVRAHVLCAAACRLQQGQIVDGAALAGTLRKCSWSATSGAPVRPPLLVRRSIGSMWGGVLSSMVLPFGPPPWSLQVGSLGKHTLETRPAEVKHTCDRDGCPSAQAACCNLSMHVMARSLRRCHLGSCQLGVQRVGGHAGHSASNVRCVIASPPMPLPLSQVTWSASPGIL